MIKVETLTLTTRRLVLLLAAASMLTLSLPLRRGHAQSAESVATGLVKQTATELVDVVNGNAPVADKQRRLQNIVESAVDVDGVGRFTLGRFWRMATPDQQKEFLRLFHTVLVTNITSKLGEFKGVGFEVGQARPAEGEVAVSSTVFRPNNPPSRVDWLVRPGAAPKIIDVIAEGTSLRLTQRSDYAAYITRNGDSIAAMLDALRRQAAAA